MFITTEEFKNLKTREIYICYRSHFIENHWKSKNIWKKLKDLNDNEFNNYIKNRRHYYSIDDDLFKQRIKLSPNIDLLEQEFDCPYEVINHFARFKYDSSIDNLLIANSASFKMNIMQNMIELSKRNSSVAIRLFDFYIANEKTDKSNTNELTIPAQLINLIEGK